MKSLEQTPNVVYKILRDTSSVFDIVDERIYPIVAAQSASAQEPYIVYRRTGSNLTRSKDGNSGLGNMMVEVEIYANTYDVLTDLATKVRQTLDGQAGTLYGHSIQVIAYESTRDNYQDAAALDGIFMLQQDYLIIANTN